MIPKRNNSGGFLPALLLAWACCLLFPARAASLVETVPTVKRSVVGIGSQLKTRSPAIVFSGTGFVVGDGLSVITNAHVVAKTPINPMEQVGIVVSEGANLRFRPARVVATDPAHDLAHLRLDGGSPLPALQLGNPGQAREGQALAFTGFPLGMVLGLHHATHRATLASITPLVMPSMNARQLNTRAIGRLQGEPMRIYQLDGTAYPGNSGSPVYDPETGVVIGVINMVFVKGLKESAISAPSGIAYAIPVEHVIELLARP